MADQRTTFTAFLVDYTGYGIAMSAISMATYLPMFLESRTDSKVVIGLIPAIYMLGRSLTGLVAAPYLEQQVVIRRKMVAAMLIERFPVFLCGAWIWVSGPWPADLVIGGVLGLWTLYALGNGWASTAWGSYNARALTPQRRGEMNGYGSALSALGGLAVVPLVREAIEKSGLPAGYGVAVAAAGLLLTGSALVFLTAEEVPFAHVRQGRGLRAYAREMLPLLRADVRFSWFLVATSLWLVGSTAISYYTVYAMRYFAAGPRSVMWYTLLMAVGAGSAGVVCGRVAAQRGYRVVFLLGLAATSAVMLLVFAVRQGWVMYPAFVLAGWASSATWMALVNLPMELGDRQRVPTYVAVSAFVRGPVGALAPLAAGVYLEFLPYGPLYLSCTLIAALAFYVVFRFVGEPRGTGTE